MDAGGNKGENVHHVLGVPQKEQTPEPGDIVGSGGALSLSLPFSPQDAEFPEEIFQTPQQTGSS